MDNTHCFAQNSIEKQQKNNKGNQHGNQDGHRWRNTTALRLRFTRTCVCSTAIHSIPDVSTGRIISGLLFPFGLGMVMLGFELFTGNVMIAMSVLSGETAVLKMLRNKSIVYLGNLIGGLLLALACTCFGQMEYSQGGLAVYTIKVAAFKCSLPFGSGVVLGPCATSWYAGRAIQPFRPRYSGPYLESLHPGGVFYHLWV